MLNGVDPIIIFNFKKIPPGLQSLASMPIISSVVDAIDLPAIPIYLSERLTGICIDTEDKSLEVDTKTEGTTDGAAPVVNQNPISSTVRISMVATRDSIGVALFSAMADLVFPKLVSKEYSITYLHGAVTIFAGLLHSFSINQDAESTKYTINLELIKPSTTRAGQLPAVAASGGTGAIPNATL